MRRKSVAIEVNLTPSREMPAIGRASLLINSKNQTPLYSKQVPFSPKAEPAVRIDYNDPMRFHT
jgi:hypothetical protein